jgi:shikimate kinase
LETKSLPNALKIDGSLVLVGLMGCGKSAVGRRLAVKLDLPFVDSDEEIERAAGCSIEDIFEIYGEAEFRALESRVIDRLLESGPMVLATGGGAFMNEHIRAQILQATTTIWLKADLDILFERTSRRTTRPLLNVGDPRQTLKKLIDERYPVYAKAHIIVETDNEALDHTVDKVMTALCEKFGTPA